MLTKEDVLNFVRHQLPELETTGDPQPLSGGLMNHVWQIPALPYSVVVKYAPPYIASAPSIKFDDSRIIFEARALEAFDSNGLLNALRSEAIRPPKLISRDDQTHTLILEDIGDDVDLAVWLSHTESKDFSFATLIGKFIGLLHKESFENEDLKASFNNTPIQDTRKQVQYDAIGALCAEANLPDSEFLGNQAKELGRRLLEPGVCMIMGDLWPPSIRVTPQGIRIIDWEFVHFGNPAQDIGHLGSHLWMLQHRIPARKEAIIGFWHSCIQAYKNATRDIFSELWKPEFCTDAAIHFGAEIIVRTLGPFQQGYLYDGLPHDHPFLEEAIQQAANCIREPESLDFLDDLFCRSA